MSELLAPQPFETKYTSVEGFPFSVRQQTEPNFSLLEVQDVRHDRTFFAYPTVSVPEKEKFLKEHFGPGKQPKNILTITGALWPAFYANIWKDDVEHIQMVDPNPKAFEYLASLMKSDNDFTKMVKGYAPTLTSQARTIDRHIASASYLEDIDLRDPASATSGTLTGLLRYLPPPVQRFVPRPTNGAQIRARMRESLTRLARDNQLEGIIGMFQDVPGPEIQRADFIDLSNVPEYDRSFPMQQIVQKARPGSYIYMEEINHANPIAPKVANLPLEQKSHASYTSTLPTGSPFQQIDFFLFRKK